MIMVRKPGTGKKRGRPPKKKPIIEIQLDDETSEEPTNELPDDVPNEEPTPSTSTTVLTNGLKRPLSDGVDSDKKKKFRLTDVSEDELEVTEQNDKGKNHIELLIQKVSESLDNTNDGTTSNDVNNSCELIGNSKATLPNGKNKLTKNGMPLKGILKNKSSSDNLAITDNIVHENVAVVDDNQPKENITTAVNDSTVRESNLNNSNTKIPPIEKLVINEIIHPKPMPELKKKIQHLTTNTDETKSIESPCNSNTNNSKKVDVCSNGIDQDFEVIDSDNISNISLADLTDLPEDISSIISGVKQMTKESFPELLKLFSKKELTFDQFDSMCTQKMVEVMTDRSYWGKDRSELQLLKEREKHWRSKYSSLDRQFKEIKTIVNVHKQELKSNEQARPHLVTRTVGLQAVLCPRKEGSIKLPKQAILLPKPVPVSIIVEDDDDDDVVELDTVESASSSTSKIANTTTKKHMPSTSNAFHMPTTSKLLVVSPKNVTTAPKNVAIAPKNVAIAPKNVAIAPKNVAIAPKNVAIAPKNVTIAPKNVTIAPKNVTTAPNNVTTSLKTVTTSPKTVTAAKSLNTIGTTTIDLTGNDDVTEDSNIINLEDKISPTKNLCRSPAQVLPLGPVVNNHMAKSYAYVGLPNNPSTSSSFIMRTASGSPQRTIVSNKDTINTSPKSKNLQPILIEVSRVDPVLVQPCTVTYTAHRVPVSGTLQPMSTASYTPRKITMSQLSASLNTLTPSHTTCKLPVSRISGSVPGITLPQSSPGTSFTTCRLPISLHTIPHTGSQLTRKPPPPAIPLLEHPSPVPGIPNQKSLPTWKRLPPAPNLTITKSPEVQTNPQALVLSWTMNINKTIAEVIGYQIYAYQETPDQPPNIDLWKKIGDVDALPLPMACSLTHFSNGQKYHFLVRAVDVYTRVGPFSLPESIT